MSALSHSASSSGIIHRLKLKHRVTTTPTVNNKQRFLRLPISKYIFHIFCRLLHFSAAAAAIVELPAERCFIRELDEAEFRVTSYVPRLH